MHGVRELRGSGFTFDTKMSFANMNGFITSVAQTPGYFKGFGTGRVLITKNTIGRRKFGGQQSDTAGAAYGTGAIGAGKSSAFSA